MRRYDLAVIGGGTAGLIAALVAAGTGARVCLVEQARVGGECLWTGCVPSKSLLAAAGLVQRMRDADRVAWTQSSPRSTSLGSWATCAQRRRASPRTTHLSGCAPPGSTCSRATPALPGRGACWSTPAAVTAGSRSAGVRCWSPPAPGRCCPSCRDCGRLSR